MLPSCFLFLFQSLFTFFFFLSSFPSPLTFSPFPFFLFSIFNFFFLLDSSVDKNHFVKSGANAVLLKPLDLEKFNSIIKDLNTQHSLFR